MSETSIQGVVNKVLAEGMRMPGLPSDVVMQTRMEPVEYFRGIIRMSLLLICVCTYPRNIARAHLGSPGLVWVFSLNLHSRPHCTAVVTGIANDTLSFMYGCRG